MGATVTPGNDTYGTYAQVIAGAAVTSDAYGIWINFNSNSVSAVARDTIAKIGFDPAGGTTYTDVALDLLCSCAGIIGGTGLGGVWYYFPLWIPAGTSIGVAASVHNATVGTLASFCKLAIKPSNSSALPRTGTFVRTFGSTPASSSGTAITPNAAGSKSAYVQLGSATAEPLWYWCLGVGCNNTVMNNNSCAWDLALGDASNKLNVIVDQLSHQTASEVQAFQSPGVAADAATGSLVYVRAGSSAAQVTGISAAAYAVGG